MKIRYNRNMNKNAAGNIIFIILIAIALFGGLSFALTKGFQGANETRITKQQAKAAATAIIKYGTDIQLAISRMQLNNDCSEEQISFERAPFDGSDTLYVNPNSPTDFSCHVFHPNGGGISYQVPSKDWLDDAQSAQGDFGYQVFVSECVNSIGSSGTGTSCNAEGNDVPYSELVFFTPYLKLDICNSINKLLGYDESTPLKDNSTLWADLYKFKGTFRTSVVAIGPDGWQGTMNRCLEGDVNPPAGTYHYYQVLVPR